MNIDELTDETREKLNLSRNFPNEVVSHKVIILAKILSALKGLTNRVALSLLDQAKLHITGQNAESLVNFSESTDNEGFTADPPPIGWTIQVVTRFFHLTTSDIKGRKRDADVVLARQVAMYIIRQGTDCSLMQIGKELGGRSPATISYGYQKIAKQIAESPAFSGKIKEILSRL